MMDMNAICKYCVVVGVAVWAIVLLSQQTDAQQCVMQVVMLAIAQSRSVCVTRLTSLIRINLNSPNITMKGDNTDLTASVQYYNTQCKKCLHKGHWYNYSSITFYD